MWPVLADDIATHCGLHGLGIESQWGRDFVHLSRKALPDSYSVGIGVFLGLNWPGHSVNHPPPRNADVNSVAINSLWSLHELF